jgi:uncharacterized membrane protein
MAQRKATLERLSAFSDGVFSVIITIMVLELKPPEHPSLAALLPLWPTGLSYVLSYTFIAIVWVNHHHVPAQALKQLEESLLEKGRVHAEFQRQPSVSMKGETTGWVEFNVQS